jgi:hypothetical protein
MFAYLREGSGASIGDHDVDFTDNRNSVGDELCNVTFVCDVTVSRNDSTSQFTFEKVERWDIEVARDDFCSLRNKAFSDRSTDSRGRAGDESDFALEAMGDGNR